MLEGKKINLDLPVDAYDAEGNLKVKPESVSEEVSTEGSQPEEKKEEVVDEKKEEKEIIEEQRVPYSRFSKIRERAEEAERKAEEAMQRLQEIQSKSDSKETRDSYEEEYSREIKTLYGDTPIAKQIIDINLKHQRAMEERAERRALEAVENARDSETKAISQNEGIIDSKLEDLSDTLGRELTPKEEEAILEIVDEYTPVGEDGKYAGEILPFDKAWEVYELRQEKKAQTSKKSRSAAVNASSSRTQGEPSGNTAEENKNWNPLNWKSLYDRIGK